MTLKKPDMKKYLLVAASAFLLLGYTSVAQDTAPEKADKDAKKQREVMKRDKKKMGEYEEIIIKRKDDDKDAKVTIEIKDDEVFVDGKPIDDFVDDDISIQRRDIKRFKLNGPPSQFRMEDGDWSMDGFDLAHGDRAFLGVTSEGSTEGAKILSVSENSGAAKAGLKKDDVITKVNDKSVFDHEQLAEAISGYEPDEKVTITYKRNGKENKTTVTLGRRAIPVMPIHPNAPNAPIAPVPPMIFNFDDDFGDGFQFHNSQPKLGIKVQDMEDGKGVKVLDVDEGSAAQKAGILKDDIITSFEGKEVGSAGELARASREARNKSTLKVDLNRNGKKQTIDIKIPKKLKTANL
jgi:serine protease Do